VTVDSLAGGGGAVGGSDGQGPAIVVSGLVKRYGPNTALGGVDLTAPFGEVTALIGRNGAGKSTLIRIIATLVLPDEGHVLVDGHDVAADPNLARRHLGLALGEDRSFFWRLSGRRNLEFFAALHGLRAKAARTACDEVFEAVGLTSVADRRVDRYSTGMRSRLGIARALLGAPSVLLLDEPTRSLDPDSALEIQQLMASLARERNTAVVVATHDLHEAATLASQVLVMMDGRVRSSVTPNGDVSLLERAFHGSTS
jgi:ABC-2 type transport system ATP-binding protein